MDKAEHHADRLRDGRGGGRRPDAPVEYGDEQQVEHDVDQRRENQVVQRAAAVAQRVHDALAGVVHHDGENAEEVVAEIGDGLRQDVRVGAHPAKEGRRQRNAENGQDNAAENGQQDVRMDGAGDARIISGSKIAGDGDARAHRHAGKEADDQEDQRSGRADGGQRLVAKKTADDQCVRGVVKLLEHLTEQNGNGKRSNEPPRLAAGHVHGRTIHIHTSFL